MVTRMQRHCSPENLRGCTQAFVAPSRIVRWCFGFNSQALAEVFANEHSVAFFHQKAPEKNRGMKYGYNTHSAHHMAISPAAILETSKHIIFRRIDLP